MGQVMDILLGVAMIVCTICMMLFGWFSYVLFTAKPSKGEKAIAGDASTKIRSSDD